MFKQQDAKKNHNYWNHTLSLLITKKADRQTVCMLRSLSVFGENNTSAQLSAAQVSKPGRAGQEGSGGVILQCGANTRNIAQLVSSIECYILQ